MFTNGIGDKLTAFKLDAPLLSANKGFVIVGVVKLCLDSVKINCVRWPQ